jgi:hypothetical protein
MPTTILISAAEDIDLDAEPEEGVAAESAEARDFVNKKEQLAETAQKEAEAAEKAAEAAEAELQEALSLPEADRDEDRIKTLTSERDKAGQAMETAHRKAVKARAKLDQAREALEIKDHDSPPKPDEKKN